MAGFNKVILMGNMVADPEVRIIPSGASVCSFKVAVGRRFKSEGGTDADFFSCEAWRNTADFIGKYFKKGSGITLVGSIQNRNWTDQNGIKRYSDVIIIDEAYFAGRKSDTSEGQGGSEGTSESDTVTTATFEELSTDEDLPF